MSVVQSIHIQAPVAKVFEFWKDPRQQWTLAPDERITLTEVHMTDEGVGTYYNWRANLAGITFEGFGVFTEFVPGQRITDKASRGFDGTWTYTFEPEGSGTKFTMQRHPRSFWAWGPLDRLMDRFQAPRHENVLAKMKVILEAVPESAASPA